MDEQKQQQIAENSQEGENVSSPTEGTSGGTDKQQNKGETHQFLTFLLANETYGLDILTVQEIRGWGSATPIPNAPTYIRGVINLRGEIVPILDVRRRFNMDEIEFTATTVVIVVNIEGRTIGMVVDGVSDVIDIQENELRSAPDFGSSIDASFVSGLASIDDRMVIILNITEMLKGCDLLKLQAIASSLDVQENI